MPASEGAYDAQINGRTYIAVVDTLSTDSVAGHYYSLSEGSAADRHEFAMVKGKHELILSSDGKKSSMNPKDIIFNLHHEPEFVIAEDTLSFRKQYSVFNEESDVIYGKAMGYWTSLQGVEADISKAFTSGYIKSFKNKELDLSLDLYIPEKPEGNKPLIMFMHGGAFYVGDKKEPAYIDFCEYFASLGYVTASINYRMGFHLGKGEIERAGYVALQDAHAAMRYIVSNADRYGIDKNRIFVAGSSAGSITALNLAFMDEDSRPESSYGGKGLFNDNDLGEIDKSGNEIKESFKIKAVANMWGAVSNLGMINNRRSDIISFHGDADAIVPYAAGFPFSSAGKSVARMLSDTLYGSFCIDSVARKLGRRTEMHTFKGEGHALNTTGKEKQINNNHIFIRERIEKFFYKEMVPVEASIVPIGEGKYILKGNAESVSWKVDGGFIIESSGNSVSVLWAVDSPTKCITASGTYKYGIGFIKRMTVN